LTFNKPALLSLWEKNNTLSFTLDDIQSALGAHQDHTRQLSAILEELVGEGLLAFERKQYRMVHAGKPRKKRSAEEHPHEVEGKFSSHRNGFGFVDLQTEPRQSYFVPPPYVGGALDQDLVRAEIVMERRGGRPTARVKEVLERSRKTVRGYLQHRHGNVWVLPLNEKLPAIHLEQTPPEGWPPEGSLVETRIQHFPTHVDEAPGGILERLLDPDDSIGHIIGHILADQQIETGFTPDTLKEMERLPSEVVPPPGRADLSSLALVTIDGEDAKDFDDAVYVESLPGGKYRLLVAIADVAEYVRPGSSTDTEAFRRGTSIYLPDRVLPMLPEVLSNELCSLKPKVFRLALVCDMTIDPKGDVSDYQLYEAVIKSQARLTYNQVQAFFDSKDAGGLPEKSLAPLLTTMHGLFRLLEAKRRKRGAVALELPETRFQLNAEGIPDKVIKKYPTEATRLIEQFMLEANETVAVHAEKCGLSILYRVHEAPPDDSFYNLTLLLNHFGIQVALEDIQEKGGLNRLLERIQNHPTRDQIEMSILRSMSQAQYRHLNDGHFGLASDCYTHFTSPIRRYPDLLLHRALKMAMARADGRSSQAFLLPENAGAHLSSAERTAAGIETLVNRLFAVVYMESRLGQTFPAQVSGVTDSGVWLVLPEFHVEGFMPMDQLPPDQYRLDRTRNTLTGRRTQQEIGFGSKLHVLLAQADRHTQKLEFQFVQWEGQDKPDPANQHRKSAGKSGKPESKSGPKKGGRGWSPTKTESSGREKSGGGKRKGRR